MKGAGRDNINPLISNTFTANNDVWLVRQLSMDAGDEAIPTSSPRAVTTPRLSFCKLKNARAEREVDKGEENFVDSSVQVGVSRDDKLEAAVVVSCRIRFEGVVDCDSLLGLFLLLLRRSLNRSL